ncbi:MAG: hypothetical protein ABJA10_05705 [Aestuariivirga sp.]
MTVTISRLYDSYWRAEQAVSKLKATGIPDADISLIANRHVSAQHENVADGSSATGGAGVGAAVGGGAGLLAGIGLLAIPGLGPVVAAGWLAATAVGAIGGAAVGGLVGALVNAGVPEADAHIYSESIRRGGTMVTVRTADANETTARGVLDSFAPVDVATRRLEYQKTGWKTFDPAAPDYTLSDAELERARRRDI